MLNNVRFTTDSFRLFMSELVLTNYEPPNRSMLRVSQKKAAKSAMRIKNNISKRVER